MRRSARMIAVLATALAVGTLLGGCCSCEEKAAKLAREWDAIQKRVQPDDRLTAAQRAKLFRDEDAFRDDIAAVASGK